MTIASSVLTTTDINGGTIDGTTIGGTTPAAGTFTAVTAKTTGVPLEINSTNSNDIKLEFNNNGTTTGYIGSSSSYDLSFYNSSASALAYLNDTGFGIGTTPSYKLHIAGAASNTRSMYVAATNTSEQVVDIRNTGVHTAGHVFYVYQGNASSTAPALTAENSGTGNGIFIDQNGNGIALNIDSEATTSGTVNINADASTSGTPLYVQANSLTNGLGAWIYSNSASFVGTGLLRAHIDNASATGTAFNVINDGTGSGVYIDQNGNGRSIYVDTECTDQSVLQIDADTLTAGNGVYAYSNSASFSSSGGLLYAFVDHASATGRAATIRNDGTGYGVFIDQNGNGVALNIDSAATSGGTVQITSAQQTGSVLRLDVDSLSNGQGIYVQGDGTGGGQLIAAYVSSASATTVPLSITNNGTGNGIFIDQNGSGNALYTDGGNVVVNNGRTTLTANGEPFSLYVQYNNATSGVFIGGDAAGRLQFSNSGGSALAYLDGNGNLSVTGQYIEDYNATGTSGAVTIDLNTGNNFSTAMAGAVTYTFSNAATSGTVSSFTLKVVNNGSAITWPASVDWPGGTAPTLSASGATDVFTFFTHDGGTTWYGFTAGQGMA